MNAHAEQATYSSVVSGRLVQRGPLLTPYGAHSASLLVDYTIVTRHVPVQLWILSLERFKSHSR